MSRIKPVLAYVIIAALAAYILLDRYRYASAPAFRPRSSDSPIYAPRVRLTHYAFEIYEKHPYYWTFKWSAWVVNREGYWVPGFYIIEFRDKYDHLVHSEISPTVFPNTDDKPRQGNSLSRISAFTAERVDLSRSRVRIEIEQP